MFERIVVPTDFSDCAQEAWDLAKRIGAVSGGELILAHVLSEVPAFGEGLLDAQSPSEIEAAARKWATASLEGWIATAQADGLTARATLRTGYPDQEIVGLARDERADLIVIGTHGRSGMSRVLLGSVADRVVRLAPCPVLTVRQPPAR